MGVLSSIRQRVAREFTRLAVWIFDSFLHFYPPLFREEYGDEMHSVFMHVMDDAGCSGWRDQCGILLRELLDYPGCLLRAHLSQESREDALMSLSSDPINQDPLSPRSDDGMPGSWEDTLLAALPLMAVGLLSGGLGFLTSAAEGAGAGWQSFVRVIEIGLVALFVLSVPAMTFLAWRRGWPRWYATWIVYLVLPLVALINWPLGVLGFYWIQNILIYVQFPLSLAILVVAVGERDRLRGLLAAIPILPLLWMFTLEFTIPLYRTLVTTLGWLLAGLVAALILRKGSVRYGLGLALGYNLLVGLMYSWARTFHNNIPLEHVSTLPGYAEFFSRAISGFLSLSTLLLAPVLVWEIRQLGLKSGKRGVMGYSIAVSGLFIELIGYLASFWFQASDIPIRYDYLSSFTSVSGVVTKSLIYLGMLIYLTGMVLLASAASKRKVLPGRLDTGLLALIPLALPLMGTAPLLFNFSYYPPSMPYEIGGLRSMPIALVYTLGALWLLVGCWVSARRHKSLPTGGGNSGGESHD